MAADSLRVERRVRSYLKRRPSRENEIGRKRRKVPLAAGAPFGVPVEGRKKRKGGVSASKSPGVLCL